MAVTERLLAFPNGEDSSPATFNDRELVVAYQSGESFAYANIDRKYRPIVNRICQRLLANPHDAEEAAQETMLRVLVGLGRFNGQYKLDAWVARIATNVCLDLIRKSARRPQNFLVSLDTPEVIALERRDLVSLTDDDPAHVVIRRAESERVIQMLESLPGHHRDALVLREFEGRSHEEIADALGMTPKRAKALLHRARRLFRETWIAAFVGVLAVLRALESARRFIVDPVKAEASPLVNASVSSPALSNAITNGGDRIVASVAAIAVVGAIGAGSVVVRERHHHVKRAPSFAAQTHADLPDPMLKKFAIVVQAPKVSVLPPKTIARRIALPVKPKPPAPKQEPPAPAPSVEPMPPEPTEATFAFGSNIPTSYRCGCGTSPNIDGERVDVANGAPQRFSQRVSGIGGRDASGEIAWNIDVEQESTDLQHHTITFIITTPEGQFRYMGQAFRVAQEETAWGGLRYVFEGTYAYSSGPTHGGGELPDRGRYRAAVTISQKQGRIFGLELSLTDDR